MLNHKRTIKIYLLLFLIIILVISCIHPVYPEEILLQHITTFFVLGFLTFVLYKNNLSNAAFFCFVVFTIFHIIGARWNYSNTPYDKWIQSISGLSIDHYFDFKRNQYDRLVHFLYGFLLVIPVGEIYSKWFSFSKRASYLTAFLFILASSTIYELLEWGVAIVLSPEQADAYNGQQGDFWDAQKDMALAMLGALIMIGIWLSRDLWLKKMNRNRKQLS